MINKFLIGILALLCIVCVMPVMAFSGAGSGTSGDPYVITTTAQWAEMIGMKAYFILGNSIDFQSDPAKSITIPRVSGSIDGRGYALQNFYNNTPGVVDIVGGGNNQYAVAMIGTGYNPLANGYSLEIKNLILEHCILLSDTDYRGAGTIDYGLLTGGYSGYGGDLDSIYVDENSHLILNNTYINGTIGRNIGGISGIPNSITNSVFRGNIFVNSTIRVDPGVVYDYLGGIQAQSTYNGQFPRNVLNDGTMIYTMDSGGQVGTIVGYQYPVGSAPNSRYFDSTTLAGVPASEGSWGVPTSGMTTQSNFPNMTFGVGYMAMSDLGSIFHGYPVPYYFTMITPTPTPTPTLTPTPTYTGTPVPTGTPTPVPTPTPTLVSPSAVRWTNPAGTTIASAYIGDSIRYSFDTVASEDNNPVCTEVCNIFYVTLYHKNPQTSIWIYDGVRGFNVFSNTTNTFSVVSPGHAWSFDGHAWKGWGQMTAGSVLEYKAVLMARHTAAPIHDYQIGSSTITISQNPLLVSNFGSWLGAIGGDGLRFSVGVMIVLLFMAIPFLITRQFNFMLEMMMAVIAVGINMYVGLFDLWVVFALAIGILAVFILMKKTGGT